MAFGNEAANGILRGNMKNTSGLARLRFVAVRAFQHQTAGSFGVGIGAGGGDQHFRQ